MYIALKNSLLLIKLLIQMNPEYINLGNYEIIKQIGKGAFGEVYLVEDKNTHRSYAAKVAIKNTNDLFQEYNLNNEIKICYTTKYPSILKFIGFSPTNFKSEPYPTIISDYKEKDTLRKVLQSSQNGFSPKGWEDTTRYITLLGIAFGMKYLYTQKIIHRDLKPENILMDNNFYPFICDFGLSKKTDKDLKEYQMNSGVGTKYYMAPEILAGKKYNYKVDVYSFSIVAAEIISNTQKNFDESLTYFTNQESKDFIIQCHSFEPKERPTFYKICKYIVSNCFIQNFSNISLEEVFEYMELFEESDSDVIFFHSLMLFGQNQEKSAIELLKTAIEKGNSHAMLYYAIKLGNEDRINECLEYLKLAADAGNLRAMYNYALLLYENKGLRREAAVYFKKSADEGFCESMEYYAFLLSLFNVSADSCKERKKNKTEALKYYKMAADKGSAGAMYNYANMLDTDDDVASDKNEALVYYKKSADLGFIDSIYCYANLNFVGSPPQIKVNRNEALVYYKKATAKFDCDELKEDEVNTCKNAILICGMMQYFALGVSQNKEEGINYLKKIISNDKLDIVKNFNLAKIESKNPDDLVEYVIEKLSDITPGSSMTLSLSKPSSNLSKTGKRFDDINITEDDEPEVKNEVLLDQNGFVYELFMNDFSAQITKLSDVSNIGTDVVIPATIKYESNTFKIKKICESVFFNSKIESLSFDKNSFVEFIDKNAFYKSNLIKLSLPKSLEKVDENWISGAENLREITVDPENQFFSFRDNLLIYNNNQDNKNSTVLFAPKNLQGEFILPQNVTKIGYYSFYKTDGLSLIISKKQSNQKAVTLLCISPYLKEIDPFAFYACRNLKSISFKENSKLTIGSFCFSEIQNLNFIEFDSIQSLQIGKSCFENCGELKSVNFHKIDQITIGSQAFKNCDKLDAVLLQSPKVKARNECFNKLKSISYVSNSLVNDLFNGCAFLSFVNIECKEDIKIHSNIFDGCKLLNNISIKTDSKLVLNSYCFGNLLSLNIINLNANEFDIGKDCFLNCTSLNYITFHSKQNLSLISDIFLYCSSLKEVKLSF